MSKESKCFAFGSVSGCREQCPVLIDGDCKLYTSAEHYNTEMELAALRAELAEKESELAELREQNKVLREEENVPYLRELKENAELRERLKPVCIEIKTCETCEHDYYKSLYCSPCQVCKDSDMWQEIKTACEEK